MTPTTLCVAAMLVASPVRALVSRASTPRRACHLRCCLDGDPLIDDTLRWLDRWVIRHNLCPFASAARAHVRTVVCPHGDAAAAADVVADEVARLRAVAASEPATTLVVLPAFDEFEDLMELQAVSEERVDDDGAVIQLLVFHPLTEFDTPHDPADLSLRSPHPMLHLLRDDDVLASEAQWTAAHAPATAPGVQERNAAYLRGLGWDKATAIATAALAEPGSRMSVEGTSQ
jgi:hypothetical protein